MENNDSPYIYEKPLAPNKSRRAIGLAVMGIAGLSSVIGGSAVASVIARTTPNPVIANATSQPIVDTEVSALVPTLVAGQQEIEPMLNQVPTTSASAELLTVPVQTTKPAPTKFVLPTITQPDWGNTSSATPTASSGSNGASTGKAGYQGGEEREDREDREDYDEGDGHDED